MNQKLGRKRRDAAWQQSHLHGWGHDRKKMLKLSSETLYAFGVLSNVFHEVMFLHKALQATAPREGAADHIVAAHICQTMTLVRILAGKIWEARTRMNDKTLSRVLREQFFPLRPGHADQWKQLSRYINAAPWLATLRNNHAFHYPTFEQIGPALRANWPTGGGTVLGLSTGNCFFLEADQALMLSFFEAAQAGPVGDKVQLIRAFGDVLSALYGMSTTLTTLLVELLADFVERRVWDGEATLPLGEVESPSYESIVLPYFVLPNGTSDRFSVTATSASLASGQRGGQRARAARGRNRRS